MADTSDPLHHPILVVLAGPWRLLPSEDRPLYEEDRRQQHPEKESTKQCHKQFTAAAASPGPFELRDPCSPHPQPGDLHGL